MNNFRHISLVVTGGVIFVLFLSSLFQALAQTRNNCEEQIELAKKKYYDLEFEQAVSLLEDCKKEKDALELLANIHFAKKDTIGTKESIKSLLDLYPDYKPEEPNKPSFISFFENVKPEILADLESARKSTNTIVLISAAAVIVGVVVAVLLLSQ